MPASDSMTVAIVTTAPYHESRCLIHRLLIHVSLRLMNVRQSSDFTSRSSLWATFSNLVNLPMSSERQIAIKSCTPSPMLSLSMTLPGTRWVKRWVAKIRTAVVMFTVVIEVVREGAMTSCRPVIRAVFLVAAAFNVRIKLRTLCWVKAAFVVDWRAATFPSQHDLSRFVSFIETFYRQTLCQSVSVRRRHWSSAVDWISFCLLRIFSLVHRILRLLLLLSFIEPLNSVRPYDVHLHFWLWRFSPSSLSLSFSKKKKFSDETSDLCTKIHPL